MSPLLACILLLLLLLVLAALGRGPGQPTLDPNTVELLTDGVLSDRNMRSTFLLIARRGRVPLHDLDPEGWLDATGSEPRRQLRGLVVQGLVGNIGHQYYITARGLEVARQLGTD